MTNQGKATQNFVPIKEVRDGVLVRGWFNEKYFNGFFY